MSPTALTAWLEEIFGAVGATPEAARAVSRSLLEAELAGHESHGLIRVDEYLRAVADGQLRPTARPEVVSESGSFFQVDGHWGFGAFAASWTTERLHERIETHGVAAASLRGCGHLGRAGDYPAQLAREGCWGLALVSGGGAEPRLAPFGGAKAFFGTNPVAMAVPGPPGEDPIVTDFSTAAVASGKIRVLRDKGEKLPPGWILDAAGQPSVEPADYYAGGMLVPMAEHKGYGLALMAEILAGLVSGAGSHAVAGSYRPGNGLFLVGGRMPALGPALVSLVEGLRQVPPVDPERPVQLPGEPESRCRRQREEAGLTLTPKLRGQLDHWADQLKVARLP